MPDAVIFDNDGLLLDTEEAWTRAERELFRRHARDRAQLVMLAHRAGLGG